MATYQFSALADGQAIAFNPNTDVLNFDQSFIGAAWLRIITEGASIRISVPGLDKDVVLLNTTQLQLATSNVTFANGSLLLHGDNSPGQTGDNNPNSLLGTSSNDLLAGFGGADTLNGGAADDTYVVSTGDVLIDSSGWDTVISDVSWTLGAAFENLTLTGTATSAQGNNLGNVIEGNNANNSINGRAGDDILRGFGGNDTFDMSTGGTSSYGSDQIDGGDGVDTIDWGANARSALTVDLAGAFAGGGGDAGAGTVSLFNVENVVGGNFNDSISGSAAANFLYGAGGNDTLAGGDGNDRLEGAAGNDSYLLAAVGAAHADIIVGFASGADKIRLDASVMDQLGFEGNFTAGDARYWASSTGTAHDANDRILFNTTTRQIFYDADGNGAGARQLIATLQGGSNVVATDFAVDNATPGSTINGTEGDDSILGTFGNDTINGLGGNDTIDGNGGADSINGGDGNDFIEGGRDEEFPVAGDTLVGGNGNDSLFGARFTFSNNPTADHLDGGLGDDQYAIDHRDDVLVDVGGIDTVIAKDMDWTLGAGFENLRINNDFGEGRQTGIGNALDNEMWLMWGGGRLEGLAGNDTLHSGVLTSDLFGGDGDDVLFGHHFGIADGGAGNDTLGGAFEATGGAGADHFMLGGNSGAITDFTSGTDRGQLDGGSLDNTGPDGNFAAGDQRFWASASGTAHDTSDRVLYNTSTGELFYDPDGSGSAQARLLATLQGAPTVAATDFYVINGQVAGDQINGTSGDDMLSGTEGDDTLNGLGGNDELWGNGGDDLMQGGDGRDRLNNGPGNDTMLGGAGDDTFYISNFFDQSFGQDVIDGGAGRDMLAFIDAQRGVFVNEEGGIYTGPASGDGGTLASIEIISGTRFADHLIGDAGADELWGGGGNDTLAGMGGDDTLLGSAAFEGESTWMLGGDGNDLLQGGNGAADSMEGGNGDDRLMGSTGNDTLNGDAGNDRLEGGNGNDFLNGGGGADTFFFAHAGAADADQVTDFASGLDELRLDGFALEMPAGDFTAGDARFWASSSGAAHDADDRVLYNTTTRQVLYDADGNGSGAARLIATLQAGAVLAATDIGVDGGSGGGLLINGTEGDDSIVGSSGNDTINGLGGNDTLLGAGGSDRLDGGDGNDSIGGGGGDELAPDTLIGGDGNDTLNASSWWQFSTEDQLDGGLGDDMFIVDLEGDTLTDAGGIDTVIASETNWTLADGFENLVVSFVEGGGIGIGNAQDNVISAFRFSSLQGLGGNDTLSGQLMDGGTGNDVLDGFEGDDNDFLFTVAAGSANADEITNFESGVDRIRLDGTAMSQLGPNGNFDTDDARFWASAGGAAHDADDRVLYNTTTRQLFYDADGNGSGAAQLIVTLQETATLSATDIWVDNGTPGAHVEGSFGDDSLVGTAGDDTIEGFAGNDTLEGLAGHDLMASDEGDDLLNGGLGRDTLNGGSGNDTLNGGAGADRIFGGAGSDLNVFDTAPGASNVDAVLGFESGGDTLSFDLDVFTALGAAGRFSAGDARFHSSTNAVAHDADDRFIYSLNNGDLWYDPDGTGAQAAVLVASLRTDEFGNPSNLAATDILVDDGSGGGGGGQVINGTAGNDNLIGTAGNDTINGLAGDDTLDGAEGDDQLSGGDGNDVFSLGHDQEFPQVHPGSDTIDGGAGTDAVSFSVDPVSSTHDVNIDLAAGTYEIDEHGVLVRGSVLNVENVTGSIGQDTIQGSAVANLIDGSHGDDVIRGFGGNDTLFGGISGSDLIDGGDGDDLIISDDSLFNAANDTLIGGLGNDTLVGYGGDDIYVVTSGDIVTENAEAGIDTVQSGSSWALGANFENLMLTGTAAITANGNNLDNVLTGNDANNSSINGRAGNDSMFGMGGNDTFDMSTGGTSTYGIDVIDGGSGTDTVDFGANARTAVNINLAAGTMSGGGDGGAGSATLASIENAVGGNFNDVLTGNAAANFFYGAGGNDTLVGGAGNDRLQGAAGNDAFVFNAAPGTANSDVVVDFATGVDKLQMENAVMSAIGAAGNFVAGDARFWAAAGATSGHDANDRIVYNTSTGNVYYDADGSGGGAAQLIATLQGQPALAATDIAVI